LVVGRVAKEGEGSKEAVRCETREKIENGKSKIENGKWKMEIGEERHVWAGKGFLMRKCEGGCAGMTCCAELKRGNAGSGRSGGVRRREAGVESGMD
jgi:hypothetical protein